MKLAPPPPRICYRIELLDRAGHVTKSVSVRGYRPTAHRAAYRLGVWERAHAYQLRRLRDDKPVDHRELCDE